MSHSLAPVVALMVPLTHGMGYGLVNNLLVTYTLLESFQRLPTLDIPRDAMKDIDAPGSAIQRQGHIFEGNHGV